MTFPVNSTVQLHEGFGSILKSLGGGALYSVELADGSRILATPSAMKPAPSNVTVFRKPVSQEYRA